MATDIENGQVGMKFGSDQPQIAKVGRVSAVIDRGPVLDFDDVSDGHAPIDRWHASLVAAWDLEIARVYGLNEGYLHLAPRDGDFPAWIAHNVKSSLSSRKLRNFDHRLFQIKGSDQARMCL